MPPWRPSPQYYRYTCARCGRALVISRRQFSNRGCWKCPYCRKRHYYGSKTPQARKA